MSYLGLFIEIAVVILPITLFIFLNKKQKIALILINVIMLAILIFSYNYYVSPYDRSSYAGLFWIIYFLIPCFSIDILIKVIMLIYSKLKAKQVIK
ncbi:MAG: hypothetical protein BWY74_00294 [Firmicutes bacterium ADurb.Bin419]|nr:MAG: hypothetical protein BWY74_00294 [Firmicutes bacterium ADurb.Bin419]